MPDKGPKSFMLEKMSGVYFSQPSSGHHLWREMVPSSCIDLNNITNLIPVKNMAERMSTLYIFFKAPCTLCQYVLASKDLKNAMVMLALKRRLGELKCECSAKRVTKYWFVGYFKGNTGSKILLKLISLENAIMKNRIFLTFWA